MPANSLKNEITWQPGELAKTNGKTTDSARQVPMPAKLFSLGEHGENEPQIGLSDAQQYDPQTVASLFTADDGKAGAA